MGSLQYKTVDEILKDVGKDSITHLRCNGKIPLLNKLCPMVKYLYLANIPEDYQLESLSSLTQLERLYLSKNNFKEGLSEVVGALTSLTELYLNRCQLQDLPESLSSLTHLEVLELSYNNFKEGLPEAVGALTSLTELNLISCQLKDLPASLSSLTQLKKLVLSYNNFKEGLSEAVGALTSLTELNLNSCQLQDLPESLSKLSQLEKLNISMNYELTKIDEKVMALNKLQTLCCVGCTKLISPPYAVCRDGIHTIREYFKSLSQGKEIEVCDAPVAIVGNSLAGKTSIVKSLRQGKRVLTKRSESDVSFIDEVTKGFEVHDLKLQESTANLIDHGGQDVYHIAYQYALKENNIPLFVVSFKQFLAISHKKGSRVAAKETCWDWMSHLYLSCPLLGPPLLVFTHADAVSNQRVKVRKNNFLEEIARLRKNMLAEESGFCGEKRGEFQKVLHLSNTQAPVFHPEEVFIFSDDQEETSNIRNLKLALDRRCQVFKTVIPGAWNEITEFVTDQTDKSVIKLSLIEERFSIKESHTVLRYMHNTGSILWYNQINSLQPYVFHQIHHIIETITLLFHHRAEEKWKERLDTFFPYLYQDRRVNKAKYEEMVEEFQHDGILDSALLYYLLTKESAKFSWEVSVELLKSFKVLHGPVHKRAIEYYLIPFASQSSMDGSWKTDGDLQLRLEIQFGGLPLPIYAFHLAIVKFLDVLKEEPSLPSTMMVRNNGSTIYHGESSTHFVHFFKEQRVTVQVSTSTQLLASSWKRLIETTRHILEYITSTWKACRPSVKVVCPHCLYLRDPHPGTFVDPDWLCPVFSTVAGGPMQCQLQVYVKSFSGFQPTFCSKREAKSKAGGKPTIPSPLVYPCYSLSVDETQKVTEYLSKVISQRRAIPSAHLRPPVASLSIQNVRGKRVQLQSQLTIEGDDSELSDSLDYLNEHEAKSAVIRLSVKPSRKAWAKKLFDSSSVYAMSNPKRGRCLVINNIHFVAPDSSADSGRIERTGSQTDQENVVGLFKNLSFVTNIYEDLPAKEMLRVIREETEIEDHKDYGMFVLVVMTHGNETHLYGTDRQAILRTSVNHLLSPWNFPRMAGKSKLLIFQACSGGGYDLPSGDITHFSRSPDPTPTVALPSTSSSQSTSPSLADALAGDDFFIMNASFPGYVSERHDAHGSFFIRALVEAFYKHSCHRDVKRLFEEQIAKKVRTKSIEVNNRYPRVSRQQPTLMCWPTDGKKLYLFPGYTPPPTERQ
ncbi:malignant fibrous histiocytoma-amplified sequence 1-like [Watersipora subatra]|uniref:malignant fibrous histiocytoma-amplified sequence 1-like n=1 Tax=Watersipora subatra TaxID=2589382 RepID=UPI00355C0D00